MIVFRKNIAMIAALVATIGNVPLKSKVFHDLKINEKIPVSFITKPGT